MKLKARGPFFSFFILVTLQLLLPITILVVLFSFCKNFFLTVNRQRICNGDTILLTGGKMTKSLQLARLLKKSGYKIILSEEEKYWASGHAWSNCVDTFYLLPAKSKGFQAYQNAVESLVEKEEIKMMIPVASPISVYRDARLKKNLGEELNVFHFSEDELSVLDNKFNLCAKARELGLSSPDVYLVTSRLEIKRFNFNSTDKKFILKSLLYAPVERLKRPLLPFDGLNEYLESLSISVEHPWVLQEFISGQEFCTHSTVHNGEIILHCCCESSEFQLRYKHVEHPTIFKWVKKFVKEMKLTGQISFDFIVNDKGDVMPIECNPRAHSALTTFYNSDYVAESYLLPKDGLPFIKPCTPKSDAKETFWLYHELWELLKCRTLVQINDRLKLIFFGKEAILDPRDPLPFIMVYHWQIPSLLIQAIKSKKTWFRIDFNIGKLIEVDGD